MPVDRQKVLMWLSSINHKRVLKFVFPVLFAPRTKLQLLRKCYESTWIAKINHSQFVDHASHSPTRFPGGRREKRHNCENIGDKSLFDTMQVNSSMHRHSLDRCLGRNVPLPGALRKHKSIDKPIQVHFISIEGEQRFASGDCFALLKQGWHWDWIDFAVLSWTLKKKLNFSSSFLVSLVKGTIECFDTRRRQP